MAPIGDIVYTDGAYYVVKEESSNSRMLIMPCGPYESVLHQYCEVWSWQTESTTDFKDRTPEDSILLEQLHQATACGIEQG